METGPWILQTGLLQEILKIMNTNTTLGPTKQFKESKTKYNWFQKFLLSIRKSKSYVFYINVGNLETNDIAEYMSQVKENLCNGYFVKYNNCFFIPVRNGKTKIERLS